MVTSEKVEKNLQKFSFPSTIPRMISDEIDFYKKVQDSTSSFAQALGRIAPLLNRWGNEMYEAIQPIRGYLTEREATFCCLSRLYKLFEPAPSPPNAPLVEEKAAKSLIKKVMVNNPRRLFLVSPQAQELLQYRPGGMSEMEYFKILFELYEAIKARKGYEGKKKKLPDLANKYLRRANPQMNSRGIIYIDCPDNLTIAWYLISKGDLKLCPMCGEFFSPYDIATERRERSPFCPNCRYLRTKERNKFNKAQQRKREAHTINVNPINEIICKEEKGLK
ncbi:hypothetical protein [Atribacter laminatus]|uniref:Uncharacterized protein n=1 Tax=Atribacter laminatus TaxID=2847778 RepID=A0A7T1F2W6_ATRLM|nr:hypothetical protein [Atribacter laminatus]QPM68192.1 hypothetical protein RT761_01407 [Atribacter laminatus]